jgi:transglutaminase-like putative cysteine protease
MLSLVACFAQESTFNSQHETVEQKEIKADRKIPFPQLVWDLKLRLVGLSADTVVINDARQIVTYTSDRKSVDYTITAKIFNELDSLKLPISQKGYEAFLSDSDGIQVSDQSIQDKAKEIVAAETNAFKAACKIKSWVYLNVTREENDTPASAIDVLKTGRGTSRHAAVLYAALARATGIPTKIITGIAYDNGIFKYHTWAESYVGIWVPLDPTLAMDMVDATHIKFTEVKDLNVAIQSILQTIGEITAEIVDYNDMGDALDGQEVSEVLKKHSYTLTDTITNEMSGNGWTKIPDPDDRDEWLGMYRGNHKIGYCHRTIQKGRYQGKDAYRWELCEREHYRMGDEKCDRRWSIVLYTDDKCVPIKMVFYDRCPPTGDETPRELVVTYNDKSIEVKGRYDGEIVNKTIQLTDDDNLVTYCQYELGKRKLAVGDDIPLTYFHPWNLALYHFSIKVIARETITVNGKEYDALMVERDWPHPAIRWELENGEVMREDLTSKDPTWPTQVRETREEALKAIQDDRIDLYKIKTVGTLRDLASIRELKVKLNGIHLKDFAKSQFQQTAKYDLENETVEFTISPKDFNPAKSLKLPISDDDFTRWLVDSPGIEVSDKSVRAKAREIVGKESNAYRTVAKIRDWVIANVKEPDPETEQIASESATEVLKSKIGSDSEMDRLYTALARAEGLPTRYVAGIRYTRGSFRFWTWVESYVGEWVPIDFSQKTGIVDATYIKFSDAPGDDVYNVWWIAPQITAEVLSHKLR